MVFIPQFINVVYHTDRFADIEEACIITDYCTKEKYKTATVLKEVLKHDLHSDI